MHHPKARNRLGAQSHKYESVPEILVKVGLYLPIDVQMRDLEWAEPVRLRGRSYAEWADEAKARLVTEGVAQ